MVVVVKLSENHKKKKKDVGRKVDKVEVLEWKEGSKYTSYRMNWTKRNT